MQLLLLVVVGAPNKSSESGAVTSNNGASVKSVSDLATNTQATNNAVSRKMKKSEGNSIKTAKAVNEIPGVHVQPQLMQTPAQEPPIKGFHPIKRVLQPVEELEKQEN